MLYCCFARGFVNMINEMSLDGVTIQGFKAVFLLIFISVIYQIIQGVVKHIMTQRRLKLDQEKRAHTDQDTPKNQ